jgi:invasion protein IalB
MAFRSFPRFWGFVAALVLSLGAMPALAEKLTNGARFGEWTLVCEAVAVNETTCVLSQRLVRPDGALLVDMLAIPMNETGWLIARVPVGVHFPGGFVLRPEEAEDQVSFVWQACSPELCEAMVDLSGAASPLLDGGTALAAYRPDIASDPLVFRVSLEGLRAGLQAMVAAGAAPPQDMLDQSPG